MDNTDKEGEIPVLNRLKSFLQRQKQKKNIRQEIQEIIDEVEEKGIIDEDQGEMIENFIVLNDTTVREAMVPKIDIISVDHQASLQDVVDTINTSGLSIIPLSDKATGNILGVVYAKDILRHAGGDLQNLPATKAMRPPYFVPEGKKLIDLLIELRDTHGTVAFVIDEYGNVDGLVTMEDIMDEIFGEHDGDDNPEIILRADGKFQVDPKMSIWDFAHEFKVNVPEGDYDTVAGFITAMLERIPKPGETFEHQGLIFEIVGADRKRISRLIVQPQTGNPS